MNGSRRDRALRRAPRRDDVRTRSAAGPPAARLASGRSAVPSGRFFAMGDNRDESQDSRFWGSVPLAHLEGRAVLVLWSVREGPRSLFGPRSGVTPFARYRATLFVPDTLGQELPRHSLRRGPGAAPEGEHDATSRQRIPAGRGGLRAHRRARASCSSSSSRCVRIVPLHIHGNEVLDAMNEAANFGGLKAAREAPDGHLPARRRTRRSRSRCEAIRVESSGTYIVISARYEQTADIFGYKYVYTFDKKVEKPVF